MEKLKHVKLAKGVSFQDMPDQLKQLLLEEDCRLDRKVRAMEQFGDVFPKVTMEPLFFGEERVEIEGRYALVGEYGGTKHVYDTSASKLYHLQQHDEAVGSVLQMLESPEMTPFGKPSFHLGFMDNGARMHFRVQFDTKPFEVAKGDIVNPFVILVNTCDRSKLYQVEFGANRVWCSNGAMTGQKISKLKTRHIKGGLNIGSILEPILEGLENFADQVGLWSQWMEKRLSLEEWGQIWEALPFGNPDQNMDTNRVTMRKEILALPEVSTQRTLDQEIADGSVNMGLAFNVMTQFLTHHPEMPDHLRHDRGIEVAKVFESVKI